MAAGRASLWGHRDFCLLWVGQSVSEAGTAVSLLAVPLVAIDLLHATTFQVGALTAVETLPFLLVGLPAGAWVDRMRRRPVLMAADAGRAAALATIPLAWALGVLTLVQLYVVALVTGVLTVFFDVAYQSYLPVLVERHELVEGNGKLAASSAGARVVGPGLGGVLVHAVGAATAILTDSASYVVSLVSLALIGTDESRPARRRREGGGTLRSEIAEGLRFVLGERRIRSVAGATATSNLFSTLTMAVLVLFMRRSLHMHAGLIGLVFALGSAGALVGAALGGRVARRFGVGQTILWSILVCEAAALVYPLATRSTAVVLMGAGGAVYFAASTVYNVNQVSMRQALCPGRLQGRMNASVRFLIWGTMPIGGLLGGVFGRFFGLRPTLWIGALGGMCSFLWILPSPVPRMRDIPEQVDDHVPAPTAQPELGVSVESPMP